VRTFEHFVLALFYNACAPHRAVVATGEVARKSPTLVNAVISELQLDDSRPKPNGFLHPNDILPQGIPRRPSSSTVRLHSQSSSLFFRF
jgi:hypothetical protein